MAEYRFYPQGETPHVSTFEFHEHRERAPHLEQPTHRGRLEMAAGKVMHAARLMQERGLIPTVSDLGCGDGGLLQLISRPSLRAWGYDFQPSNAAGWAERGVKAEALNVFDAGYPVNPKAELGGIVVMTEVLEHLNRPHQLLNYLKQMHFVHYVVASSPWTETPESHDECHAWGWDFTGYYEMFTDAGWHVISHQPEGMFQVLLAEAGRVE